MNPAVNEDVKYAIREAEILYWSTKDSPSSDQIISCAAHLSGIPRKDVKDAYRALKLWDINR